MRTIIKVVTIGVGLLALSACGSMSDQAYSDKYSYAPSSSNNPIYSGSGSSSTYRSSKGPFYSGRAYKSNDSTTGTATTATTKARPKPYAITPQDEQKYQQLNDKLQGHMQQIQKNNGGSDTNAPSATMQPSSNGNDASTSGATQSQPIPPKATQSTPPFPTSSVQ